MDKEKAIRKIKALAALVASDNPHEAEAAARQMAAMMEQYRIEEGELRAAEVEECAARAGAVKEPVKWECRLALAVAEFYGAELLFSPGFCGYGGEWRFIGVAPAGQLAEYAFEQLFTKAKSARRAYMAEKLKRIKVQKNKSAKADLFSEGWVRAVAAKLPRTRRTEPQRTAIDAYMQQKHPSLGKFSGRQNTGRQHANDWQHQANGREAGKEVALHNGVTTGGKPKLIEGPMGMGRKD
jgi:hypothetical protein